jgi:hypothetical protein
MEDYVAGIAAPPMEAAAFSSNSELPAILMILPNDHRLLQKLQHILLPQMTFETFLTVRKKHNNVNKNKRITAFWLIPLSKML